MTHRSFVALSVALLFGVGCSQNATGPNGGPGGSGGPNGGSGTPGGTGTADCQLAGEWAGSLRVLAANGIQLPPQMQIEVPGGMRFAFGRAGRVTQAQSGFTTTYSRVGDEVIGGNPMGNGVVFSQKVLKLTASANQVELHIKSYSGQAASQRPTETKVYENDGVARYTFTLNGNQLEVRYVGTSSKDGRTEVIEMGGIFQRIGGDGGNGGGPGGNAGPRGGGV